MAKDGFGDGFFSIDIYDRAFFSLVMGVFAAGDRSDLLGQGGSGIGRASG